MSEDERGVRPHGVFLPLLQKLECNGLKQAVCYCIQPVSCHFTLVFEKVAKKHGGRLFAHPRSSSLILALRSSLILAPPRSSRGCVFCRPRVSGGPCTSWAILRPFGRVSMKISQHEASPSLNSPEAGWSGLQQAAGALSWHEAG